jgi:hypothetical protein
MRVTLWPDIVVAVGIVQSGGVALPGTRQCKTRDQPSLARPAVPRRWVRRMPSAGAPGVWAMWS